MRAAPDVNIWDLLENSAEILFISPDVQQIALNYQLSRNETGARSGPCEMKTTEEGMVRSVLGYLGFSSPRADWQKRPPGSLFILTGNVPPDRIQE